ncbi:MAG: ATP-binding cassette domain-containing protein [Candidatus Methanofastidiosa archaeon]|jgi:ABC-2 type transport system ATP-binding protein|nr:ATP-binding cassette domain-containing protein [Candidatus Methanofastidiosa archaeon]
MIAIDVKNLTKKFDQFVAVDNISFQVEKGGIFAFLGPNGAGKSTVIKMMTTILYPTDGSIFINNYNIHNEKSEVRKSIGVIFQDHTLDDELTAYENLYYHSALYKIPETTRRKKIDDMLHCVGLLDRKDDLVKTFSGGMKRRIEIARGLLHSPTILFLDEPTLGLDVQTRAFLWNYIKKINKEEGITIFFTTHNMEEVENIATKIAIIDKGRILIQGTSKEIEKATKTKTLENAFLTLTGYDIREQPPDNTNIMKKRFLR